MNADNGKILAIFMWCIFLPICFFIPHGILVFFCVLAGMCVYALFNQT